MRCALGTQLLLAALAGLAFSIAQEAPSCSSAAGGAGCGRAANEDDSDEVAALHLQRRPVRSAQDSGRQVRWRDASEVAREHLAALEAEAAAGGWPHHHHQWSRPVMARSAQEPPQKPPYGPFRRISAAKGFGRAPPPPSEEIVQPRAVSSQNGLLDTVLVVDWGWVEFPKLGVRFRTRLYNGTFPGPTLRFRRGDHLRIRVINRLGKDMPNDVIFQRREGQGTGDGLENGLAADNPKYQNVGQTPGSPTMMRGRANNYHHPNSTNLHPHGLHVANFQPEDEVLVTKINPGGEFLYEIDVSPYHSCGTSWYHPHLHGATLLQIGGGLAGALVVEDSMTEAPKAEGIKEVVAVIQQVSASYFGPEFLKFFPDDPAQGCFEFNSQFTTRCNIAHRHGLMANLSGDKLWKVEYADGFGYQVGEERPTTEFFAVNGQYRPTISIETGKFVRLRLVMATANDGVNLVFNTSTTGSLADACEMYLISKDNVPLPVIPRLITKGVFLASGNRAQVLLRCSKPGSYPLQNTAPGYAFTDLEPYQIFMFLNVTGPEVTLKPPKQWRPDRPRYLHSLLDVPLSEIVTPSVAPPFNYDSMQPVQTEYPVLLPDNKTMTQNLQFDFMDGMFAPATSLRDSMIRFVINNMTFNMDHPSASFPVGQVVQVFVANLREHSWHMHTHPVQFQSFGAADYKERWGGYFEVGDWADTLAFLNYDPTAAQTNAADYSATVRFQTDCYSGKLVVHCHVLEHEDLGMMTVFDTTGEEYIVNPHFENQGVFKDPPAQCLQAGQQCAPAYCTDYKYGPAAR